MQTGATRVTRAELALAGLAVVVGGIGLSGKAFGGDYDPLNILVDGAVGAALAGCGLALRRLPGRARAGLLVYLAGVAWLAENLVTTDWQPANSLGVILAESSPPVIAHALLAYPAGRLAGRAARALVVAGYVNGFGLGLLLGMTNGWHGPSCECPRFWLLIDDDGLPVRATLADAHEIANLVLAAGLVVILLQRWRAAETSERLALGAVLPPALVFTVDGMVDATLRVLISHVSMPVPRSISVLALGAIGVCALWGVHRAAAANEPAPYSGRAPDPAVIAELTKRERIVLGLMAEGYSNQAIAERLVVSPRTVETHVARIFRKLSLPPSEDENRRVRAVLAYLGAPAGGQRTVPADSTASV